MGEKRYAIGVDIGGTTVKLGLFNLEEKRWKSGRSPLSRRPGVLISCLTLRPASGIRRLREIWL